jgi:heme-degrading monooxygenase HmoA
MTDWRMWLAQCGVLLSGTAIVAMTVSAAEPPKKVLRHVVLYKFKDDVKPEQIEEVIAAFNALPSKIDTIIGYEHGTNVSHEGKSEGLTHCFLVTFASEKDRDAYISHPAHQAYVKIVRDRREKVVVADFWSAP